MGEVAGLIEKLEKLSGPDKTIDCELYAEFFIPKDKIGRLDIGSGYVGWWPKDGPYESAIEPPRYTASIDAAVALVEKAMPDAWYMIGKGRLAIAEPLYGAQIMFGSDEVLGDGEHETRPAIALCIALLRALSSKDKADG